jgi:hypothetical protein
MAPVSARLVAGLHGLGYEVDVITADPAGSWLPRDDSLVGYAEAHARRVLRLLPSRRLLRRLVRRLPILRDFPDTMGQLDDRAVAAIASLAPASYQAIISVSPFHSVNEVMLRVKRQCPTAHWIAYFCDPWAANPIERRALVRRWNAWQEPRALRAADYVVHSSPQALDLVLRDNPWLDPAHTRVVPHAFDPSLYPQRPKQRNEQIILRYIGTLFGRRSPQPVFRAMARLLERKPELVGRLRLELIGAVHADLADRDAESSHPLPPDLVHWLPPVPYRDSLALMYDADILLLIEADVAETPFVPSKVTDYMGADTPIIGIVPAGGCREVLRRLRCPAVAPTDIDGLTMALAQAIDRTGPGRREPWCDEAARDSFSLANGARAFADLLPRVDA